MHVTGKLVEKFDIESGTTKAGKEWKKQSFKINQGEMYNPEVVITVMGDERIRDLEKQNIGDELEVQIYLSSREWNGKFYHNITGWTIVNTAKKEINYNPTIDLYEGTFLSIKSALSEF